MVYNDCFFPLRRKVESPVFLKTGSFLSLLFLRVVALWYVSLSLFLSLLFFLLHLFLDFYFSAVSNVKTLSDYCPWDDYVTSMADSCPIIRNASLFKVLSFLSLALSVIWLVRCDDVTYVEVPISSRFLQLFFLKHFNLHSFSRQIWMTDAHYIVHRRKP